MRRLAALTLIGLLTACTTVEDLAPVANRTDVSVTSKVTRAYPRFNDSDPHDWSGHTPWKYAVHGTDVSKYPQSPTCKIRPPAETVRSEMRTFLQIVEKHYGKKPIIYTSIDFFDDNKLSTFHGYPYWLRSVAGHPQERYGSHPFTFWQYTGTGVVPGITGDADINVFNGSEASWKKWLRANTH